MANIDAGVVEVEVTGGTGRVADHAEEVGSVGPGSHADRAVGAVEALLAGIGTEGTVAGAVGVVEPGGAGHEAVVLVVAVSDHAGSAVGGLGEAGSAVGVAEVAGAGSGVGEVAGWAGVEALRVTQRGVEVEVGSVGGAGLADRAVVSHPETGSAVLIAQHAERGVEGVAVAGLAGSGAGGVAEHVALSHVAGVAVADGRPVAAETVHVAGTRHEDDLAYVPGRVGILVVEAELDREGSSSDVVGKALEDNTVVVVLLTGIAAVAVRLLDYTTRTRTAPTPSPAPQTDLLRQVLPRLHQHRVHLELGAGRVAPLVAVLVNVHQNQIQVHVEGVVGHVRPNPQSSVYFLTGLEVAVVGRACPHPRERAVRCVRSRSNSDIPALVVSVVHHRLLCCHCEVAGAQRGRIGPAVVAIAVAAVHAPVHAVVGRAEGRTDV